MQTQDDSFTVAAESVQPERSIGDLAVELPGATAVFRRLKLDFCCGGQISLREAVVNKQLDLEAILTELRALKRSKARPGLTEPGALIDHLLSRFHAVHREQLPELIRMARRVEAVHRDHPDVPSGLADALESMHEELLSHMEKEETVLFPMLLQKSTGSAPGPIQVMRAEHVEHGSALEQVMSLTHDALAPAGACNTWRALYAGVAQLNDDLINHIHLENNVLFPQFEASAPSQGCGPSGCACS